MALTLLPASAGAVQLASAQLPASAPWSLPLAPRLAGIDNWRLHGVFRRSDGSGWALLSNGSAAVVQVEPGALVENGIRLELLEAQGVWLSRGAALVFLPLSGGPAATYSSPDKTAPAAVTPPPSAACQALMAGGVPAEELAASGRCPPTR